MCKYFEESFWSQLDKDNIVEYEKQLPRLLKKPFEFINNESPKQVLIKKYFSLTKFGIVKPNNESKINDDYIILKNDNYLILREFVNFFHLETDKKVEDMSLEEIYDSLVKVIVTT
jgi:hypothetical protein